MIRRPRAVARRRTAAALLTASLLLGAPALASAHARVSPPVSLAGQLQLYTLAVPTEKSGTITRTVVLTVPSGFGIDSFAPPPSGWHMTTRSSGTGANAVVEKVTWSGGHTPTGQDSVFSFLAQAPAGHYVFEVRQTYADGQVVEWDGPENADAPAPAIDVRSSLGSGGTPLISIVAIVLSALALLAAGVAMTGRGGDGAGGTRRPLV